MHWRSYPVTNTKLFCRKIPQKLTREFSIKHEDGSNQILTSEALHLEEHPDIHLRWDPNSGQFSYSQDVLLQKAALIVREKAQTNPDCVAVIWRRDKPLSEEMVSFSQLSKMIEYVAGALNPGEENSSPGITVIYLPVSILAVASLLACAFLEYPHTLILEGFSQNILTTVLNKKEVICLATSEYWPQLAKTLEVAHSTTKRRSLKIVNLDPSCGLTCPVLKDVEPQDEELDPLFALYTGGETSVIAGLGEVSGYYQVTSNIGKPTCDVIEDNREREEFIDSTEFTEMKGIAGDTKIIGL